MNLLVIFLINLLFVCAKKMTSYIIYVLNSRSVSVDLDGVDAVLGKSAALQEGAVVADLHTLTGEVTGLKQLDAVVLSMLTDGQKSKKTVGQNTEMLFVPRKNITPQFYLSCASIYVFLSLIR